MKPAVAVALLLLVHLPLPAQTTEEQTVIRAARSVTPAVVSVSRRGGAGSGVIVRAEGIVVTNAHVVGNASTVEVRTADGRTFTGQVLGRDTSVDIAVVRVNARNLPTAPIGDSDRLEPGQIAIAIGNPLGLERTVTRGVVSAVNRDPGPIPISAGLIQTDAAINPGNSGGPLLDSSGRVIGITTLVLSGATGLGFAVPINYAVDIVNQLLTTGRIRNAVLGVNIADLDPEIAREFDLPVREGAIVMGLPRNSPAAQAGIQPEDIIVAIDDQPVTGGGDLRRMLRAKDPGDTVRVEVVRGRERRTIRVELGEARQ
jgi:serine protease Do